MPGQLELQGKVDLTETPVPGVSKTIKLKAKNIGTTKLHTISIQPEGDGAGQVQLATKPDNWAEPGKGISLADLSPKEERDFYIRSSYSPADAEDRKEFQLVAMAMSVG